MVELSFYILFKKPQIEFYWSDKLFQDRYGRIFVFFASEEFASFPLKDRVDYQVLFYNINGDKDYQTNYKLAQEYFEEVNAPYKQMFTMKNMTHGLLESDSEGFSEIIHQIAKLERKR